MADINVDVNLPNVISVDVTSPTQALATNISIPGPQGPVGATGPGGGATGPTGPSGVVNTGELDLRYYSITNPSGFITGVNLSLYATTANLASTGSTLVSSINSLSGTLTSDYATISNLASTGSTLNTKINNLSGYINSSSSNIVFTTGNQEIDGLKTFSANAFFKKDVNVIQNLRVSGNSFFTGNLNVTGNLTVDGNINNPTLVLTKGEQLISGAKTFAANILFEKDITTSGNLKVSGASFINNNLNIASNLTVHGNIINSGIVNTTGAQVISGIKTFANVVSGNFQVSGTGLFNALDLNNIDILSLSGVDLTITNGILNVSSGEIRINSTGVLLSGQNSFIIRLYNTSDTQTAGHNYFGNTLNSFSSTANGTARRFPVLENCVVRKASWTQFSAVTGSPSLNSTGYFINTTTNTTGIISTTINSQSTSTPSYYIANFSPPITISTGNFIVCSLFGPTYATAFPSSQRNTVDLYCYN